MPSEALPDSCIPGVRCVELGPGDEAWLQAFFDANPAYFLLVQGEPAAPGEAHEELHGAPPPGWSFTKNWVLGYADARQELVAMAIVTSDLIAATVWHIGLFIVATTRHGRGDAQALYRGLEAWHGPAARTGCAWASCNAMRGPSASGRRRAACGCARARA